MDKCPHCAEPFEDIMVAAGNHEKPKIDDIIICAGCLGVLLVVFDDKALPSLRLVPKEEIEKYPPHVREDLKKANEAAQRHRAGLPPVSQMERARSMREQLDSMLRSPASRNGLQLHPGLIKK